MADKHTPGGPSRFDGSILANEILSLASKRLEALCEKSRREQLAKILNRRRRKWKKRHKLESRISHVSSHHHELEESKNSLEEASGEDKYVLVKRRDEGLAEAMELQTEESLHSLEVFKHRLSTENKLLQSYISSQDPNRTPPCPSPDHAGIGIIKDLEATLSQAEAFAEIKKMKHTLTPRVPQLHNRTLSGNIFDQSLGILHDTVLDGNGINSELLDSEHAHLQIIGKEVSIWQEESDSAETAGDKQRYMLGEGSSESLGGEGGGGGINPKPGEAASSPDKFPCSDDTPGIGMEVVCVGGAAPSVSMNELEPAVVSSHNGGFMNGVVTSTEFDLHHAPGEGLSGKGVEEKLDCEVEGEIQLKILRLFQDARYDLRFPVRRYSNQASRSRTPLSPSPSTEQQPHQEEEGTHGKPSTTPTPIRKKRGRPRKGKQATPTL